MSKKQHRGKFRHVFGEPAKPEKQFLDIKNPLCSGQGNYVACNEKFFAVAKSSGGGPVYIIKHDSVGRVSSSIPMLSVHKGKIWDMDFNPFVPNVIATASNDCSVGITSFPMDGLTETITKASGLLKGHSKKCVLTSWNPVANSILASGSFDKTVRVWNIEKLQCVCNFTGHEDNLYSMEWNINGSMIATTSKDKHIRVFDPRSNGKEVSSTDSFGGTKSSHVFWVDRHNWIGSTGFSKLAKRKLKLWDLRKMGEPIYDHGIDQASSILMPFFDGDTGVLFLAGKGEGKVSYFELVNDEKKVYSLGVFRQQTPQKGGGWVPKRALNVWKCEIARFLKLTSNRVQPVSFIVPRKAGKDVFQQDIFPDTYAGKSSLQAQEWIDGNNRDIITTTLDPSMRQQDNDVNVPTISIKPHKPSSTTTQSNTSTQPTETSSGSISNKNASTNNTTTNSSNTNNNTSDDSTNNITTTTNSNSIIIDNRLKDENKGLVEENEKLTNENTNLVDKNEKLRKEIETLNLEINRLKNENDNIRNNLESEKEESLLSKKAIKSKDNQIFELKASLNDKDKQINELNEQISRHKEENEKLRNNSKDTQNTTSDVTDETNEPKTKVPNPFDDDDDDDESSLF